jgi:hypothetical protein
MAMLRIVGAIALLTISGGLPAFAQAAIQEPGAYAFYHPNADVLNAGRPSTGSFYSIAPLQVARTTRTCERLRGATASDSD